MRALSNKKTSCVLGSPKLQNPPPPTTEQSKATLVFVKKKEGNKAKGNGSQGHNDIFCI